MTPNDLQTRAVAFLTKHERKVGENGTDDTNGIDVLRMICVAQQRQIEMLAGVLAEIAPAAYLKANLGEIQGLPDIPDWGEGESVGLLVENSVELQVARMVQEASNIRESSFDTEAARAGSLAGGTEAYYRKSLLQACHEACAANLRWVQPVFLMLKNSWNEALDWSASVITEYKHSQQPPVQKVDESCPT